MPCYRSAQVFKARQSDAGCKINQQQITPTQSTTVRIASSTGLTKTPAVCLVSACRDFATQPKVGTMGEADDIPDLDIDDAGAEAMPKAKAAKGPPVLPWMRVPIGVQPGTGVALERVGGLVPELALALKNGKLHVAHAGIHDQTYCNGAIAMGRQLRPPPPTAPSNSAHTPHAELHFTELFPVQSVVWQQTAGGASTLHDVCVNSPTGSGKTLAYALPVINGIIARRSATSRSAPSLPTLGTSVHYLQALVVLPTRDLAAQVTRASGAKKQQPSLLHQIEQPRVSHPFRWRIFT